VVEAAWRLNRLLAWSFISRLFSLLETSSAAAFVASAFAIAASAASFFSCASFALLVRSASDPVVPSVEPVGVDPVDPVGPDDVDPVGPEDVDPVGPDDVDPVGPDGVDPVGPDGVDPDDVDPDTPADVDPVSPPEVVMGDIGGVLEPVKKGEVNASQTTVAPSSVDFWTKQYSSLSLR